MIFSTVSASASAEDAAGALAAVGSGDGGRQSDRRGLRAVGGQDGGQRRSGHGDAMPGKNHTQPFKSPRDPLFGRVLAHPQRLRHLLVRFVSEIPNHHSLPVGTREQIQGVVEQSFNLSPDGIRFSGFDSVLHIMRLLFVPASAVIIAQEVQDSKTRGAEEPAV